MKRVLLVACLFVLSSNAARRSAPLERCNNCNKQSDPVPALMLQTFMNVLINGYVATQCPKNSEEQKQAIVNALNTLSNFGQFVLTNAKRDNCTLEEMVEIMQRHIQDPEFMESCIRSVMLERMRIRYALKPAA